MSTRACSCTTQPCGCCDGVEAVTPVRHFNRPGLPALSFRVGTHGRFFETMHARLSTIVVDGEAADGRTATGLRPLTGLTTRDRSDFSIALLDGWAAVGDVLSFYQERIANEGYLRTATERRSVLELSRLVGYTLRPGVASTVFLAYTIDDKQVEPVTIPVGARSQSIPGPDELPQSFETSEDLEARASWNTLRPRKSRPQTASSILDADGGPRVYLKGIDGNLKENDTLLVDFGDGTPAPFRATKVTTEPAFDRTLVAFQAWQPRAPATGPEAAPVVNAASDAKVDPTVQLIAKLSKAPSLPPRNSLSLTRSLGTAFGRSSDMGSQMLSTFRPGLHDAFSSALANRRATGRTPIRVYALRAKAAPFGHNAPRKVTSFDHGTVRTEEWTYADMVAAGESTATIRLDIANDKLAPGGWLVIDTRAVDWKNQNVIKRTKEVIVAKVQDAGNLSLAVYGITGRTSQVALGDAAGRAIDWFEAPGHGDGHAAEGDKDLSFQLIRRTAIHAQSEELALTDEPIVGDICAVAGPWIELDGLYSDLKSGRWVIVSGDRTDVQAPDPDYPGKSVAVPGVLGSELVMLAEVIQDVALPGGIALSQGRSTPEARKPPAPLPGERNHTFVSFSKALEYCYDRAKVTIHGNVVKATHGETQAEALGNGDGAKALQAFALRQRPLTFIAAPTAVGADSTLRAYVNDVEWHETGSLAWLNSQDRGFVTATDDADNTTLTFGNGEHGARLPTGAMNVKAVYRNGIGRQGNVRAGQVSLLQTRPLGVKEVINPLRASGGANREGIDLARENVPLSVMPLDRLVSVQDYADLTRRFAGIAKASVAQGSDGQRETIFLTIAGVDDVPIDETSDLYRNLLDALRESGAADLPLQVSMRELKMLVLSAKLRLQPDYRWEPVATAVRAQLLDRFGFARRALGQPVRLSEVISAIQGVRGVAYVDIDALGAVAEKVPVAAGSSGRRLQTPTEIIAAVQRIIDPQADAHAGAARSRAARDRLPLGVDAWAGGIDRGAPRPAELAIFAPAVPDTLILNQIP